MIAQDGLLRIFWPLGPVTDTSAGVLIGWKNSKTDILVTSILQDVEPRGVENALRVGTLFRDALHPIRNLLDRCGPSQLQVLGVLNPRNDHTHSSPYRIVAHADHNSALPYVENFGIDCRHTQIILYSRPQPEKMQYMSPYPISLAISEDKHQIGLPIPPFEAIDEAEKEQRREKEDLVKKLRLHTVKMYARTDKELTLPHIIRQINCSFDIDALLQRNINLVRQRSRRALSVSEQVVESANDLWHYIRIFSLHVFYKYIWPVITRAFVLALMFHRTIGEAVLTIAETSVGPRKAVLRDISATAQQVDLRIQQSCYWPIQYLMLMQRRANWGSISNNNSEYIRFYNSLWLVANDIIIGIALGLYINENADFLASVVDVIIGSWSLEGLRRIISWLTVYPAGLKLNNELAAFLGDLFIWVIDYWGGWMESIRPHLPQLIRLCGIISFAGATFPMSVASDLLSLSTLHIYCFYVASARIFGWQLTIISSLFHLFRGKKRNVLRNRIDSCDYELDQLLLGTILFTLLFFLLPTVAVFYFTFAFARMGIIGMKGVLDTMLACLNHFPLFALMLRVKDPRRLPGGIRFELQDTPLRLSNTDPSQSVAYITLKSIPLPLAAMFHEYSQLGGHIKKHYLSPNVFLCLATGGLVPPLHRKNLYSLQYSTLPATRVSIPELWRRLTEALPSWTEADSKTQSGHAAVGRPAVNGRPRRTLAPPVDSRR